MFILPQKQCVRAVYKLLSAFIAVAFCVTTIVPRGYAQTMSLPTAGTVLNLPVPGTMVGATEGFMPALIKGITIHPENPLLFDFIINKGDTHLEGDALKAEANTLIKYFMAGLTVPEKEMWVNLSPYEADRIIPEGFGDTEMGRDLLAQDYLLKQLTASLMYPEEELGETFWTRVHEKAYAKFGTTDIPMNTFNKIWIVPEKAAVYEHEESATAYLVDSHLKVMLEEDYVAMEKNLGSEQYGLDYLNQNNTEIISGVSSDVIREILIPEIEREVNEGETFAILRQIYHSVILATWYKKKLTVGVENSRTLLGQVYVDQNKTKGVDTQDKQINQKIYNQYVESFKKGVYDYIKEDYDPTSQQIVPRKYFSGGMSVALGSNIFNPSMLSFANKAAITSAKDDALVVEVRLSGISSDNAYLVEEVKRAPFLTEDQDDSMVSREELETYARRKGLVKYGENLQDVLDKHTEYVKEQGLSHEQLAEPLLKAVANKKKEEFSFNGSEYEVFSRARSVLSTNMGRDSIAEDIIMVINQKTLETIQFTDKGAKYAEEGLYTKAPSTIIDYFNLKGTRPKLKGLTVVQRMHKALRFEDVETTAASISSIVLDGLENGTFTLNDLQELINIYGQFKEQSNDFVQARFEFTFTSIKNKSKKSDVKTLAEQALDEMPESLDENYDLAMLSLMNIVAIVGIAAGVILVGVNSASYYHHVPEVKIVENASAPELGRNFSLNNPVFRGEKYGFNLTDNGTKKGVVMEENGEIIYLNKNNERIAVAKKVPMNESEGYKFEIFKGKNLIWSIEKQVNKETGRVQHFFKDAKGDIITQSESHDMGKLDMDVRSRDEFMVKFIKDITRSMQVKITYVPDRFDKTLFVVFAGIEMLAADDAMISQEETVTFLTETPFFITVNVERHLGSIRDRDTSSQRRGSRDVNYQGPKKVFSEKVKMVVKKGDGFLSIGKKEINLGEDNKEENKKLVQDVENELQSQGTLTEDSLKEIKDFKSRFDSSMAVEEAEKIERHINELSGDKKKKAEDVWGVMKDLTSELENDVRRGRSIVNSLSYSEMLKIFENEIISAGLKKPNFKFYDQKTISNIIATFKNVLTPSGLSVQDLNDILKLFDGKKDDLAVLADAEPIDKAEVVGGINLDSAMLDLEIKRDGNGVPLPMMDQDVDLSMRVLGFLPIILRVLPVNLPQLLGFADTLPLDNSNTFSHDISFWMDEREYFLRTRLDTVG